MSNMDEIITEQIPRLRRYARALTGERTRADELVQDTLERAWGKLHMWRRDSDMRAWMFSIMHNTFINQIRKNQIATVSMDDEALEVPTRATQNDFLEMRDLASAIGKLSYEYRDITVPMGMLSTAAASS